LGYSSHMKQLAIIGAGLAILVMVVTAVDARRAPRSAMKAESIQVGDSREQVRARLGRPTELFRPPQKVPSGMYLGVHVETWAYGGLFELRHCFWSEFPYFYHNDLGLRFLERHLVTFNFPKQTMYLKRRTIGSLEDKRPKTPAKPPAGRQPFGSETDRTPAAAASRRSP